MDPVRLKEEFGRDLVFWGGGYVFTQVHNIQYDVPPEKVLAIYETAAKYRAAGQNI